MGQEVMIMGKLLQKSWGDFDANMSGGPPVEGADVRGIKPSFVRDKTR